MQIQKPRQGYKLVKSLFGKYEEIPEEWNFVKLEEICTQITDGVHQTPTYQEKGIPFISVNNLKKGRLDFTNCNYVSIEDHKELIKSCYPQKGDVILSKVGTLGIADEITVNFEFSIFVQLALLKLEKETIFPTFLQYMLNSKSIQRVIYSKAAGTTLQYIGINSISKIKIPFPDISEQQKIASILSNVDSLIQQTQTIIEQTQKLKKGLMQKLLTKGIDHTKFKKVKWFYGKEIEIPEEWEILQLEKILLITQYGLSSELISEGKYPIFRMNSIENGFIVNKDMKFIDLDDKTFEDYRLEKGDLLFNRTNSLYLVGKIGIFLLDGDYTFASYLIRLRTNERANPMFLNYYLNSSAAQIRIKSLATPAVAQTNVNATNLKSMIVPVPSLLEQKKISNILSNFDFRIADLESRKSKLETLKKGLMQKLLTGQIRVNV